MAGNTYAIKMCGEQLQCQQRFVAKSGLSSITSLHSTTLLCTLKHPTVFVQNEMWRQDASFILLKVLKQSWFPFCTVCFPHIIYSCKRCGALQIMTWPPCAAQSAVHIESQYFQLILSPFVAITSLDWVSAEGKKVFHESISPLFYSKKGFPVLTRCINSNISWQTLNYMPIYPKHNNKINKLT